MRDLIRSYKMILKRKHSITDSDTESQPLVSSQSSTTSFGAVNECFFQHDSDTTDYECGQSPPNRTAAVNSTPIKEFVRRPFYHQANDTPVLDVYTNSETIYDRLQFLTKSKGVLSNNDLMTQKILSFDSKNNLLYRNMMDKPEERKSTQSSLITIFSIWNTVMGSSILAMSWGLHQSGFFPGLLLILFSAATCLYTAYLILEMNKKHGIKGNYEVADICTRLIGPWAGIAAKIFSLVVLTGACIVYWILMSNFLYNTVHFVYSVIDGLGEKPNTTVICPNAFDNTTVISNAPRTTNHTMFDDVWSLYSTVPVFLGFMMFPLLNFKSPTFFTKFNSLGTISVCYMLVFVVVKAANWGINISNWHEDFWEIKLTFSNLSGMLALSFFIHNIIVSIVKNNKHQENNVRDLTVAFGLVTFTYVFIGALFYLSFPLAKSCIQDNLLNNFEKYDIMSIVARVLFLFQLCTVFPLINFMLRNDILLNLGLMFKKIDFEKFSYMRVIFLNLIVVLVCILFACFLPHIGTLIRFTGAISGLVYIFTLPSLLKICSLRQENSLTYPKLVFLVGIVAVGLLNLVAQFVISES